MSEWTEETTLIERIRMVGPMSARTEALDYLHSNGWTVTHLGPYTDKKLFPKVDVTRFLYTAEREHVRDDW